MRFAGSKNWTTIEVNQQKDVAFVKVRIQAYRDV